MRFKEKEKENDKNRAGRGLDPASGALIAGGAVLLGAALVAGVLILAPTPASPPLGVPATPIVAPDTGRASTTLPAERVATVLLVDVATGAGGAARAGDRVDVLGYFSPKVTGTRGETRVVLHDVPVLSAARTGASLALTLAVPQASAMLLQEAQAIGAQPMVTLRAARSAADIDAAATSFSDADLADWLKGAR